MISSMLSTSYPSLPEARKLSIVQGLSFRLESGTCTKVSLLVPKLPPKAARRESYGDGGGLPGTHAHGADVVDTATCLHGGTDNVATAQVSAFTVIVALSACLAFAFCFMPRPIQIETVANEDIIWVNENGDRVDAPVEEEK